jgi:exonuclease III
VKGMDTGDAALEDEGRVLTARLRTSGGGALTLVNVYTPNSGQKLERLEFRTRTWDAAFRAYVHGLVRGGNAAASSAAAASAAAGAAFSSSSSGAAAAPAAVPAAPAPVLVVGDLNVAYHDMDVHGPKAARNKTAGFCDGERDGFAALLLGSDGGGVLTDVFRAAHPTTQQFTYWSARGGCRGNNKGWRLDYALAAAPLAGRTTVEVRANFPGADHVPVVVRVRDAGQ